MSHQHIDTDRIPLGGVNMMRRRRTLDERLFVRFPALAHRFARRQFQLPLGSPLRRRLLARYAAQAASAANRRDFDVLMLGLDPEVDYRAVSGPHGEVVPDLIGHHHGHAGYRGVWRVMLETFDDLVIEPQELLDIGSRLISASRLSGHGAGSGIPIEGVFFQVFTFEDGLVVEQEDFGTLAEALRAAGTR